MALCTEEAHGITAQVEQPFRGIIFSSYLRLLGWYVHTKRLLSTYLYAHIIFCTSFQRSYTLTSTCMPQYRLWFIHKSKKRDMPAGRQDNKHVYATPSRHQLPGHTRTDAPTDDRKHTHSNLHVSNRNFWWKRGKSLFLSSQ